jgi:hypothetical protein
MFSNERSRFHRLAALLALATLISGCKRLAPVEAPAPPDALPEPPAGPPPPPPPPLEQILREEIGAGGDVALLADAAGVIALSPDGQRKKVLAAGKVEDVLVDDRARVVWFKRQADHRSELVYLDLTAALGPPVLVARGRQDWQRVAVGYEQPKEIIGDDEAATLLAMSDPEPGFHRLGRCTRATRDGCLRHDRQLCQPGDDESQCPLFVAGARERLQALLARTTGRHVFSPAPRRTKLTRVSVGRSCSQCGKATALAGTKLWAVLVESVGDFCHIFPQAYDPAARQFINIQTGARLDRPFDDLDASLGDIWICPSGAAFVGGGTTGTFARGALAPWRGLSAGGCLGGGWFFAGDRLAERCDEQESTGDSN